VDNPDINAVLDVYPAADTDGPLAAAPIGVKANIAVHGQVWHGGIRAYKNRIAPRDARVVQRLRASGADILAGLNMEEGALGAQTDNPWFGRTHNPLKHGYTPGGSSGGSAAAVAAGFVKAALGTDTMGSVRIPSAYCGLWGFKPSHDRAMLDGVMPLSLSLDTVGVHGADFGTLVQLAEIICDRDFSGGTSGNVAILDWSGHVHCDTAVEAAFKCFVETRELSGTTGLSPYAFGKSRRAGLLISEVEGFAVHEHHMQTQPDEFSTHFKSMLEWGARQPKDRIDAAYAHLKALRSAGFADFILMPTAPQTAFKFGDPVPVNQADFTAFANLADRPAIQFPVGTDENGLPVGAQVVGPRGHEADLVATVGALIN